MLSIMYNVSKELLTDPVSKELLTDPAYKFNDLKVQKCELIITVPANNIQYTYLVTLISTLVSRKEDIAD